MRRILSIAIFVFGVLAGLLASASDDWGTRFTMMLMGAFFAAPIALALHFFGGKARARLRLDTSNAGGVGGDITSSDELTANYWRDKGHPPFMKPAEGQPDRHQFDPDRLG